MASQAPEKKGLRCLSLDGGGVRGLSTLIILKHIMDGLRTDEERDAGISLKPCDYFDIIAGTSTGGIIAILLGRLELDIEACITIFRGFTKAVFSPGKPPAENNTYAAISNVPSPKPSYTGLSSQALKDWIRNTVQNTGKDADLKLRNSNKNACKVLVTTVQKDDGQSVSLRSYHSLEDSDSTNPSIWEAACATLAMPPFFDVIEFGNPPIKYLDGAVNGSNPATILFDEATNGKLADKAGGFGTFISIGAGYIHHNGLHTANDTTSILEACAEMAIKAHEVEKQWEQHYSKAVRGSLNGSVYARFNVQHGLQSVSLEDFGQDSKVAALTRTYLKEHRLREVFTQVMDSLNPPRRGNKACWCSNRSRGRVSESEESKTPPSSPAKIPAPIAKVAQPLAPHSLAAGGILIAVMGVTGGGKSFFCRAATGRDDVEVGDGHESCTQQANMYSFQVTLDGQEKTVTLIDTPGFNDSTRDDATILKEIAGVLEKTYEQNQKLSGVIYLHRISDIRMDGSAIKQLKMFRELCGDDAGTLKNVVLATNRWDSLADEEIGIRRQKDLENNLKYWKLMCAKGSTVERFHGTHESALGLVKTVMRNTPHALLIQEEMVDNHKSINETSAGRFVDREIVKLCQKHEEDLAALKEEMAQAMREKDQDMQEMLQEATNRSNDEIRALKEQQRILRAENEKTKGSYAELQKQVEKMERDSANKLTTDMARLKQEADQNLDKQLTQLREEMEKSSTKEVDKKSKDNIREWTEKAQRDLKEQADQKLEEETARLKKESEKQLELLKAELTATSLLDCLEEPGKIERLLAKGVDPTAENNALIEAIRGGHKAATQIFLANQRKHSRTVDWSHLMYVAVQNDCDELVHLLIDHEKNSPGRYMNLRLEAMNFENPLHWAAAKGYEEVVQFFVDKGIDLGGMEKGRTALQVASIADQVAVVKLLISNGANVNAVNDVKSIPGYNAATGRAGNLEADGTTALHYAAWWGTVAAMQILLTNGANVQAKEEDGWTPLHLAAFNGHEAAAQLLLTNGANMEAKDNNGWTPLHRAAFNGHEAAAQLLLTNGANMEAKNNDGSTPLHRAAYAGHEAAAQVLLAKGANMEAKTNLGSTPLHFAAYNGHEAAAQLLLANGANMEAKDNNGWTPLHLAAFNGHEAAAQVLLAKGANMEAKNNNESTPLHFAAYNGHEAAAQLLLAKGANKEAKNNDGSTPLDFAVSKGHKSVERLLKN